MDCHGEGGVVALSTLAAVEARMMRALSTTEQTASTSLIAELSGLVKLRVPDADARAVADPSWGDLVSGRIASAVARYLRNPDGLVEETVGGETSRWSAAASASLTAEDWADIIPASTALGSAHVVSLWG
jgi:hypothetical protein